MMDRRAVLKATAATLAGATAVTGSLAIKAASNAKPSSLTDLVAAWKQADKAADKAQDEADEAGWEARRHYPERPGIIRKRIGPYDDVASANDIEKFCRAQLNTFGETEPRAGKIRAFRDRRLKAREQWKAECAVIDAEHNVSALQEHADSLWQRTDELQKAIFEAPAHSIADLNAKADYWYYFGPNGRPIDEKLAEETMDCRIALSIYKDIRRLAAS